MSQVLETLVISLVFLLVAGLLYTLFNAALWQDRGRYVTITLTPAYVESLEQEPLDDDYHSCAGLGHVKMCIANLLAVAKATNRTAILPPPWLYLNKEHNGGVELNEDVWWDRYFDLRKYEDEGLIAKSSMRVHEKSPRRGSVPSCKYVDPSTSVDELKKLDDKLVTLKFFQGWGGKGSTWECGAVEVGGGIGHGWQRESIEFPFQASDVVRRCAERIRGNIPGRLVVVHARRGDITKGGVYWEHSPESIKRLTSGAYIRDFLNERLGKADVTVLVMSNEKNPDTFKDIRDVYPKLLLESDIQELQEIEREYQDNFLAYEVCRYLGKLADVRVSTSPCYFYGGDCAYRLVDGIKG